MTGLLQRLSFCDVSPRVGAACRSGKYDQPFGSQYFLMLSPSVLNSTLVPRNCRICFLVRLIMPWRLPRWAYLTLPEAVILKRFLAPDLVFSLGIWLSCGRQTGFASDEA